MHDGVEKVTTLRSDIGHREWDDKLHGSQCAGDIVLGRIAVPNSFKFVINVVNSGADPVTATKDINFLRERTCQQ